MNRALFVGAAIAASLFACATCRSSKGSATPAAQVSPVPSPTPPPTAAATPLPVETPSSPSIYDRTPGILYEEKGTPPPTHAEPSPTRKPRTVTPRPAARRTSKTATPTPAPPSR